MVEGADRQRCGKRDGMRLGGEAFRGRASAIKARLVRRSADATGQDECRA
jgi:hypothetical protein